MSRLSGSRQRVSISVIRFAADKLSSEKLFMAEPASPPAMIDREPRQTRKGAAAAVDSGAGVWLVGDAAFTMRVVYRQVAGAIRISRPTL